MSCSKKSDFEEFVEDVMDKEIMKEVIEVVERKFRHTDVGQEYAFVITKVRILNTFVLNRNGSVLVQSGRRAVRVLISIFGSALKSRLSSLSVFCKLGFRTVSAGTITLERSRILGFSPRKFRVARSPEFS